MGRRKEAKKAAAEAKDKALEFKDQAREVAGQSGDALKEFAHKTKDAAKELVDTIEKAAKHATEEEPKRGRKVLKATLAIGAGVAVLSNERARDAIKSVINRTKGDVHQPEIWRPDSKPTVNGESATTSARGSAEQA